MTKFWKVTRDTTKTPHYDVANGYVIEAATREEALALAIEDAGILPVEVCEWADGSIQEFVQETQTWTCEELQITNQNRIILEDYRTG
jgi:hypothetical protein